MNFSSQGKQLCIDDFKSSLEGLNKSNRWVQLGDTLPWYEIEKLYNRRLNNGKRGAGNKSVRMIVDALVIKHKMNLSDEEMVLAIQENRYMQYFAGLSEFTDKPIFDPIPFVTIRKRFSLVHPTTYYKSARAAYLEAIKRKKKGKILINK